ncbi:MAG: zinc ribbon domain-containing protein [Actinomycetota bacterium]
MGALDDLLSVQTTDIEIAQATFQLNNLAEKARAVAAENAVRAATTERDALVARTSQIESEIAEIEARSQVLAREIARLEAQLKTVIAPREAEALQHEISERRAERGSGDERELSAMDALEDLGVQIAEMSGRVDSLSIARDEAMRAYAIARRDAEERIAQLAQRRSAQSLVVPAALLDVYERKRKQRPDGAVATLHGPTCGACHLDLSTTEIAALRSLGENEHPECPHCGCFIVI